MERLRQFGGIVIAELDLYNYTTKANLKIATSIDTSNFVKRTDLVNLKSDVNKLDIEKLKKCISPQPACSFFNFQKKDR